MWWSARQKRLPLELRLKRLRAARERKHKKAESIFQMKWNEIINKWRDCSRRFFICMEAYTMCAHSHANLARVKKNSSLTEKWYVFYKCAPCGSQWCIYKGWRRRRAEWREIFDLYIYVIAQHPWARIVLRNHILTDKRDAHTTNTFTREKKFYPDVCLLISIFLPGHCSHTSYTRVRALFFIYLLWLHPRTRASTPPADRSIKLIIYVYIRHIIHILSCNSRAFVAL